MSNGCATEEISSRLALVGDLHRSTSSGMTVLALVNIANVAVALTD